MEDANIGQSLARSGSVVVSPDAWVMCSHDNFFGNKIGKTNFMEVVHVSDFLMAHLQVVHYSCTNRRISESTHRDRLHCTDSLYTAHHATCTKYTSVMRCVYFTNYLATLC